MRFEILPGLPAYGPRAISFTLHGEREHREGLVVRFYPRHSEPWTGNFIDGTTICTAVLEHPNKSDIIVIAQGEGSIVDPETRTIHDRIGDVEQVIELPSLRCVVLRDFTGFRALSVDNKGWRSPRISWDGFRKVTVRGTDLLGEAYTPIQDSWVPFKLDLLTGHCPDGVYGNEKSRAVSAVSRSKTDKA